MKKLLLLFFFTSIGQAQIVNIPDANLKNKLLSANPANYIAQSAIGPVKIDTNNDGEIQVSEALLIINLNLESSEIGSLEGLQNFQNLVGLNVNGNNLTTINLGVMPALTNLDCIGNQLISIELSGLNHLVFLNCRGNSLTTLNVGLCPSLYELTVNENPITTSGLTGLSLLSNLTLLWIGGFPLGTIDLTGLTALQNLGCEYGNLTALDLSLVPNLIILDCSNNQLSTIDVSALAHLEYFLGNNNLLSEFDASPLPALSKLYLDDNPLTTLSLDGANVQEISISNTPITTLDLSQISTLKYFICYNSQLSDLDFSGQPNLFSVGFVDCPYLHSLNFKNGTTAQGYLIQSCANLTFICADDADLPDLQTELNQNGLTSCSVSSYCSFVPGGIYNTITGNVRFDGDENGCDASDYAFPFFRIGVSSSSGAGSIFTNNSGDYILPVQSNSTTLTPILENPEYFFVSPVGTVASFASINGSVQTKDFCLTPNGQHTDLEIVIATIGPATPGFDADYQITFKNKGNQTVSGQINFEFEDDVLDLVTAAPSADAVATGNLTFNYADLLPFETRSILITLNVNSPMETPAVNIDDIFSFNATITSNLSPDETPADNTFAFNQIVVGSLDPNDKQCLEGTNVNPTQIGQYLHYVINFENTGTAAAQNIVVSDAIDTGKFDLASLQMLSASHLAQVRLIGNKIEFVFEGINLGAAEHGNVVFKIKTKNTLAVNSTVSNTADIFFDYNFPVTTNTATTTFAVLQSKGFAFDESVTVYPNPAVNLVQVKASTPIQSINLYDAQGRMLHAIIAKASQAQVDISQYVSGLYYLQVKTDKGSKIEKLLKK